MTHTPHELAEEFPAEVGKMSALKETDAHFARLMEEYHEINREVHRAETRIAPVSDQREAELRRERAALKDQIWQRLQG